ADRIYRHYYQTMVFHPDSSIARFMQTADQLQLAIIAESARWGDRGVSNPRNKMDDWVPAVNRVVNDFFPYRSDILKNQLMAENLYVSLLPPVIKKDGMVAPQTTIPVSRKVTITMENPNSNGTVYYTTDGIDPRSPGGNLSAGALALAGFEASVDILPGTVLKARTRYTNQWSPLHEVWFQDENVLNSLKITELHYHPANVGTVSGRDLEFIELKNTGTTTLDLSGLAFTDGVEMTFPDGTALEPQQFVVIASNDSVFTSFYDLAPSFVYSGQLSNGGEKVVLSNPDGEEIIAFTFYDEYPWPMAADGDGYSLVSTLINPVGDPDTYQYWMLSGYVGGSPFADDPSSTITSVPLPDLNPTGLRVELFPNPVQNEVSLNFTTEQQGEVKIQLYDLDGRMVETWVDEYLPTGNHHKLIRMNGLNISPGLYFVMARSHTSVITRKLIYHPFGD
ncbi:MAG: lamin tail domain-containing protein, partial [Bacteroidota bacterium]